MKYFNSALFTIACLLTMNSFSQVRIGDFIVEDYSHSKLSKSDVEDFKKSTTYFVIDPKLLLYKTQFESILSKVWTVTPYEVIEVKDLDKNMSEQNSYARFRAFSITKQGKSTTSTSSYTVFEFFIPDNLKKDRKGKYKWRPRRLAAVYFTIDIDARKDVVKEKTKIGGDLMNYRLGYISNAFQAINDGISTSESFELYNDFADENELKKLKQNTLYFSEYFIYGYNALSIKEKDKVSVEELFEDYGYKYEVISDDALNEKILANDSEDFYYMMYNQINSNKILTIINGKTGKIIFQEHKKMSFNLKPKDLSQLNKTIDKL